MLKISTKSALIAATLAGALGLAGCGKTETSTTNSMASDSGAMANDAMGSNDAMASDSMATNGAMEEHVMNEDEANGLMAHDNGAMMSNAH